MTGLVTFLDEPTGWGLILGDDGLVYVLRPREVQGPRLRPDDPVAFEPLDTPRGRLATAVRGTGARAAG